MEFEYISSDTLVSWLKLQAPVSLVIILAAWWFTRVKQDNKDSVPPLTEKEKQKLIDDWQPAPLVEETATSDRKQVLVTRNVGKYLEIENVKYLNFASHNFLGILGDKDVEECAIESIKKYGVGSCGPRGFYGTFDVHLQLEEMLANFMECEEAIMYSYGFSTVASAIPAYAKRGDITFVDEMANFAIQKGLDASRSKVIYFKHNDVEDLERLLIENEVKTPKNVKPKRKYIIIEGIYMNSGKMCPLPQIVELAKKHKVRIFIDESISFGTVGNKGKGVTEYFNVPRSDIDMLMCSLEWSVGVTGGFCVGKTYVIDHQRLSGLGYCFSASLPPLLTVAAMNVINRLKESESLFEKLCENCKLAQLKFSNIDGLRLQGDEDSPIKHLYLRESVCCIDYETSLLEDLVDYCRTKKIAFTVAAYLRNVEHLQVKPSIRLSINSVLLDADIEHAAKVLQEACVLKLDPNSRKRCSANHVNGIPEN